MSIAAWTIGGKNFGRAFGRKVMLFATFSLVLAFTGETAWSCAPIPAPVGDIDAVDYRQGPGGSFDAALRARNDAVMEPVRTYVRLVSTAADRFLADSEPAAAACALSDLRQWAQAKALLGAMANVQAERERAALVSGLAFAYLKTRIKAAEPDRALIDAWFDELAKAIEAGFGDNARPGHRSLELAGLATLVVGAAIDNRDHWGFGAKAYEQALGAIDADGVLTTAMGGGERALFDQNFALGALVMMAELAARQSGEDWDLAA